MRRCNHDLPDLELLQLREGTIRQEYTGLRQTAADCSRLQQTASKTEIPDGEILTAAGNLNKELGRAYLQVSMVSLYSRSSFCSKIIIPRPVVRFGPRYYAGSAVSERRVARNTNLREFFFATQSSNPSRLPPSSPSFLVPLSTYIPDKHQLLSLTPSTPPFPLNSQSLAWQVAACEYDISPSPTSPAQIDNGCTKGDHLGLA